jgi:class 3 adenylate cyclase
LQEELAATTGDSKKFAEWRDVRERFINSCKAFLDSPAEKNLIQGYENLLKTEAAGEEVKTNIKAMQKNVRESFERTRTAYKRFVDLRKDLRRELTASFCLIDLSPYSSVQNDALLANTILSDRFISILPVPEMKKISVGVAAVTSLALFALPPFFTLLVGCLLVALTYALAAGSLIFNGLWFHPLVPSAVALTVTILSAALGFFISRLERTKMRAIFRHRLSRTHFRQIKKAAPELIEGLETSATVLAIRAKGLSAFAGTMDARTQLQAYRLLVSITAPLLTERGGALLYAEGESVLAAFGGPIACLDHAQKGCEAALALAAAEQSLIDRISGLAGSTRNSLSESKGKPFTLNLGLDTGICIFGSAGIPGSNAYSAFGHMPDRAKMLSVLGNRYNCPVLITEATRNAYGPPGKTKKLDRLVNSQTNEEESFYELLIS